MTTHSETTPEDAESALDAALELVERHASAWRRARDWHWQGHRDDWRARSTERAERLGPGALLSIATDVQ